MLTVSFREGIRCFCLGGGFQRIHSWLPSLLGGLLLRNGLLETKTGVIIKPTQTMHSYIWANHSQLPHICTSWWLNKPPWKKSSSNWIIPPGRVENKKYLKAPTRSVLFDSPNIGNLLYRLTLNKLYLVSLNDQLNLPSHQPSCKVACIQPKLFHLRPSSGNDIKWGKNHGTNVMGGLEKALKSYLVSWLNDKSGNNICIIFSISSIKYQVNHPLKFLVILT